jgi:hypothetical protein
MSLRLTSTLGCFLLLLLFPLGASAAPRDPCKLLERDLDQQIDDLKAWQKLDLQECSRISGSDSDTCRQIQDQHAQELRAFRDNRTLQMANCRGPRSRSLATASPFEISNNDFYEKYHQNNQPCVEYHYVNCEQYDRYVHTQHHLHHHHYYTVSSSGNGKPASAYVEKPSTKGVQANTDKNTKPDAATRTSVHDTSTQSAHRGSDRDNSVSHSSGHDNSPSHGSGRSDSSATVTSHHSHDSGGTSYAGGSHASGGNSDSHASSSSAGSSSSASSHSSGGGGPSSSGSSSSPASSSGSAASVSSGASASSPAPNPSHDSGGSRPK